MPRQFDPNDYDWFCDKCGSYLNSQPGWSGNPGSFTCKHCGYSNRIRKFNTFETLVPGVDYTDPLLPGKDKYED